MHEIEPNQNDMRTEAIQGLSSLIKLTDNQVNPKGIDTMQLAKVFEALRQSDKKDTETLCRTTGLSSEVVIRCQEVFGELILWMVNVNGWEAEPIANDTSTVTGINQGPIKAILGAHALIPRHEPCKPCDPNSCKDASCQITIFEAKS